MVSTNEFRIAVLPGDGIGQEVTDPCIALLEKAARRAGNFSLKFESLRAGAACYRDTGVALPAETMKAARAADAVLLAAMGDPAIRYPNGTEIAPQLDLRFEMGLYAGVRPVRTTLGMPAVLRDSRAEKIDFILIRESTEGLFASHGKSLVVNDQVATDTMVITRHVSERLFDFAFKLARQRKTKGHEGRVTCVDKANVFGSLAFFRKIFDERAAKNTDIIADHAYVDATALNMVRRPWDMDVLVTENMFGDILSDLGAGLIGGMGFAPSADIGDEHAVFQPCHGSAPDIAGQGKANPIAMFLSGAMMLDWLADKHGVPGATNASRMIRTAVDQALANGTRPMEIGGNAGTKDIFKAVADELDALAPAA
jgi:3-isopropylmalate dehydrogenase